jgi:hypothetical protein
LARSASTRRPRAGPCTPPFADFCWHTSKALSVDVFDLWLDGFIEDEQLDACHVTAARTLLEVKS